jgi:hypothetical protein
MDLLVPEQESYHKWVSSRLWYAVKVVLVVEGYQNL